MRCGEVVSAVRALADHEKLHILLNPPQAPQIDVPAVPHIEAAHFDWQILEPNHIALCHCSRGEKDGQSFSQGQRGMEVHRGVAASPVGLRTQSQAQVDQRRVHGVDRHLEVQRGQLDFIQIARQMHQLVRQRRVQSPVPILVRPCRGAAGDALLKSKMVSQSPRTRVRLDLAQALAKGHLRELQRQKMIPSRKLVPTVRLIVDSNQPLELPLRHPTDDLGKHAFACAHTAGPRRNRISRSKW
jgi:hypothetical protein